MPKIVTLGPNGSFSAFGTEQFVGQHFGNQPVVLADSFHTVWREILKDSTTIGVLPIENSSTSNVHENIDFIFRHPQVTILGEFLLPITLNLYGPSNKNLHDLSEIFSHPKAFEQCEDFLNAFNGNVTEVKSTSEALAIFAQKKSDTIGFIGGPQLAALTTASLLQNNIANQTENTTRFLLISQSEDSPVELIQKSTPKSKATIIFETFHEKGALAKVLTLISHLDGNLLKIESRPIPTKPQNYAFWIDIDLAQTPDNLIDILRKNVQDLRVVGRYAHGQKII
jgi:chorismate mutase/prephenate dehydratase